MDFDNEQIRFGRLYGYMDCLNMCIELDASNMGMEYIGENPFDDWIDQSNDQIRRLELEIKPEMLGVLMNLYCGNANIIEFDDIEYCFVGKYNLVDDNELNGGFGIVCIAGEGKFKFLLNYSSEDFMSEIIGEDNMKLDKLEKFLA
jgi:hypothetical protein